MRLPSSLVGRGIEVMAGAAGVGSSDSAAGTSTALAGSGIDANAAGEARPHAAATAIAPPANQAPGKTPPVADLRAVNKVASLAAGSRRGLHLPRVETVPGNFQFRPAVEVNL
jgi:hypothetical protein